MQCHWRSLKGPEATVFSDITQHTKPIPSHLIPQMPRCQSQFFPPNLPCFCLMSSHAPSPRRTAAWVAPRILLLMRSEWPLTEKFLGRLHSCACTIPSRFWWCTGGPVDHKMQWWKLVSLEGLLWYLGCNSQKGAISLFQCQMLSFASVFFFLDFRVMARLAKNTEQPAEDTPNSVAWWSCWRETS